MYKCLCEYMFSLFLNIHLGVKFLDHILTLWRTYLEVQWLRLCAPNAKGTASIPGQRTKIPHAT